MLLRKNQVIKNEDHGGAKAIISCIFFYHIYDLPIVFGSVMAYFQIIGISIKFRYLFYIFPIPFYHMFKCTEQKMYSGKLLLFSILHVHYDLRPTSLQSSIKQSTYRLNYSFSTVHFSTGAHTPGLFIVQNGDSLSPPCI